MNLKKMVLFGLLFIVSILSVRSFFSPGFFPMHDDAQVARVIVIARALQNGQFPVRLVADLGYGYGYPIFNFYGPLPYYTGGIIHIAGVDAVTATKIMIGLGVIIGTFSMYLLSSSIFGVYGGLFSAVLFSYFPYRAVQIFVRGAIGELWAISFLPLVLYGLLLLSQKNNHIKGIFIGALSLSAVILSHTVFGYIVTGCIALVALVLFAVSLCTRKELIRSVGLSLIFLSLLTLGMTAFFWLPALSEMQYTNVYKVIGKTALYTDHYICISQLWDSAWGFGGSAPGCLDGMSFKLGRLQILYFFISLFMWIFLKEKGKRINFIMIFIAALSGLLLFLMLPISEIVWKYIPFSSFVQYPWRFLGPLGICMAVLCGYIFYKKSPVVSVILLSIFGGVVLLANMKLFFPQYTYNRPTESFGTAEELQWRASKVSDEYLPREFRIPQNQSEIPEERVTGNQYTKVTKISETEVRGTYQIQSDRSQELNLNMAFFPGWTYSINGNQVKPKVVEGRPSVILSSGNSILEMRFTDTIDRKIGNGITVLTIIAIVFMLTYGKKIIRNYRYTRI